MGKHPGGLLHRLGARSAAGRRGLRIFGGAAPWLLAAAALAGDTTFSVADTAVTVLDHTNTTANFVVTRSGDLTTASTVGYSTVDEVPGGNLQLPPGTAQPGIDYSSTFGVLTIPAGQASASFPVPIPGASNSYSNKPDGQFRVGLLGAGGVGPIPSFSATPFPAAPGPINAMADGTNNAVADFNGDGQSDLVVASSGTTDPASLSVALSPAYSSSSAIASAPCCFLNIVTADFNGDGKPDIATASTGGAELVVALDNTANGAATPAFSPSTFAVPGSGASGVAVADLDGDGRPDVVVATAAGLAIFINTTAANATVPTFAAPFTYVCCASSDSSTQTQPYLLTAGDFNGDGKPDLVVTQRSATHIIEVDYPCCIVLLNSTAPGGSVSFTQGGIGGSAYSNFDPLAEADFNGDGKPDFTDGRSVFINTTATGASTPSFSQLILVPGGPLAGVGDLNGDGKPDLVVGTGPAFSVVLNLTAAGSSDVVFSGNHQIGSGNSTGNAGIAVGNFSGSASGRLDVVTGGSQPQLWQDTTPVFTPAGSAAVLATGTIHYQTSQPGAFSFTPVPDAVPGVLYTSNAISVSGTNVASPISIDQGQYSVNGGPYTAAAGSVNPGDSVTVQLRAASGYSVQVTANLNIGGVVGSYSVTTGAPLTPTGLSGVAGNQQVSLSWNPSRSAASYSVYAGSTSNYQPLVATTSSPSAVITGLSNNTTYYFSVSATNPAGTSAKSQQITATPVLPPPPPPPGNVTVLPGDGSAILSWTPAAGATGYTVYKSTASHAEAAPIALTVNGGSATGGTVTGLSNGTRYYFVVQAINAGGHSTTNSNEVSVVPGLPPPPGNVSAVACNTCVVLSWTPSVGAAGYTVYKGTASHTEAAPIALTVNGGSATGGTVTGLSNGTRYYFVVQAINNVGHSTSNSNEVSSVPVAVVPPPPTGVTVTALGNGSVTLAWTPADGATGYTVYKGTASHTEAAPIALTVNGGAATGGTVTGLSNGTRYYFVVQSINAVGHSTSNSNEVSAAPGVPQSPAGVTVTTFGNGSVTLGWTPSLSATGYTVYMSTASHAEAAPAALSVSGGSATGGTVSGLSNGTRYYFVVQAINALGHSTTNSNEASAVPGVPAPPTNVVATAVSGGVTFNWTPALGAWSYSIYDGTVSHGETNPVLGVIGGSTNSATVTGLTKGTRYYFVMQSNNDAGHSTTNSNEVSAVPQ
jgi:fibronectin type 3 domain-containing protein